MDLWEFLSPTTWEKQLHPGEINDKGRVKVAFSKDTWGFKPESLVLYEVQLGAFVKWQKIDEDVKKGQRFGRKQLFSIQMFFEVSPPHFCGKMNEKLGVAFFFK